MSRKRRRKEKAQEVLGFLGVGLDNKDGHTRLTRCEHFVLLGGSSQTHEHMQDTAIYFNESLQSRGKTLREASPEEVLDLLRDAFERQGGRGPV